MTYSICIYDLCTTGIFYFTLKNFKYRDILENVCWIQRLAFRVNQQ